VDRVSNRIVNLRLTRASRARLKRYLDVWMSVTALLLLAPVLAILTLLVRWRLGSPVLFKQERPGLNDTLFTLYKFRTMSDARDEHGACLPDDARLKPFGSWLRAASLDELPQLWNVIRGDMSIVGPRPLLPAYLSRYSPFQRRRHEVRPGITGWAQIHGRNSLTWEEKFQLDVWYVDNRTIGLDMKILALSVWRVLRGEGIAQAGQVTMTQFMGSGQDLPKNEGVPSGRAGAD
jgi:sugar transferase EpsL